MFTKAKVEDTVVLALAPLSVLPEYQRQGVGTALIKEGHRIARELNYGYSIVLGSEKYYPRVGYVPADLFGIKAPFDVPRENFMAYKLKDDAGKVCGVLKYAKEFGILTVTCQKSGKKMKSAFARLTMTTLCQIHHLSQMLPGE